MCTAHPMRILTAQQLPLLRPRALTRHSATRKEVDFNRDSLQSIHEYWVYRAKQYYGEQNPGMPVCVHFWNDPVHKRILLLEEPSNFELQNNIVM